MCGLFGAASNTPIKRLHQIMLQLALYNEERGKQSWGLYTGKDLIKDVGPIGRSLWQIPEIEKGVLLGHTRAATVGEVNKENAHPFIFKMKSGDRVVGAHNGSVKNHDELNKKYERNLTVDSMQIFNHIADELPLDDIDGYGAITFLKRGSLYLSRFNNGSLSIAQIDGGGIVWSSDEFALEKAIDSANLKYTLYDVKEGRIFFFSKNRLYDSQEDIAINANYRKIQLQRQQNYQDNNNQWEQWQHGRGYPRPLGNQQQHSEGKKTNQKRFVQLRVIRPKPVASEPKDPLLEEIKTQIFDDIKLSEVKDIEKPCHKCGERTPRILLSKEPTCLTCLAKMVQAGECVSSEVANA